MTSLSLLRYEPLAESEAPEQLSSQFWAKVPSKVPVLVRALRNMSVETFRSSPLLPSLTSFSPQAQQGEHLGQTAQTVSSECPRLLKQSGADFCMTVGRLGEKAVSDTGRASAGITKGDGGKDRRTMRGSVSLHNMRGHGDGCGSTRRSSIPVMTTEWAKFFAM